MNVASRIRSEGRFVPLAARVTRPLVPSLERRRLQFYALQIAVDAGSLFAGFLLAGGLYFHRVPSIVGLSEARMLLPIFLVIALYQSAYCQRALADVRFAIRRAAWALTVAAALLIFLTFYLKATESFSRAVFSGGLVATLAFMALSRLAMASAAVRLFGPSVLNVLIIDDDGPEIVLDHAYHVKALEHGLLADSSDPRTWDRLGCYVQNMDRVIISCPLEKRHAWTFAMRAAGVNAELVSEPLHDIGAIGLHREDLFTSIVIARGPLGIRSRAMKRLFDLAITIPAVIFFLPLMLVVALAIRIEDGGPVLFRQRRLGRGNRFFEVLKFRSMRVDKTDARGDRSASRDDERITRIGRLLRRTSLDELPQLFNIIAGEMSLVGPRPHAIGSQAGNKLFWEVDIFYWHRHALKPGLTGLAQVRGFRGATERERDLTDRLQADLEYISQWSVWRDLGILFATFRVLVHERAF